jgi:DNA-binding transcriptional ArsR family regulator
MDEYSGRIGLLRMASKKAERLYELAEEQSKICEIFGNARRLMILWCLLDRELSVGDIAIAAGTSMQNTSQHLRLMKAKGILTSRREGQTIYYRLTESIQMRDCQLIKPATEIHALLSD